MPIAAMKAYVHDQDTCLGQAICDAIQVRLDRIDLFAELTRRML